MGEADSRAKILIVEDNKENIDLIKYFLKTQNYLLFTSSDGVDAVQKIGEIKPDIILLDIMLPRKDGFQVCAEVKNNPEFRLIPIIMITALKELKDKIKGLEAGADDFISKPFENVELLTRVKSLLRVKRFQDELKLKNQELKEKNAALVRMDHFKEELTHLIVHDMKNPLFVIQGNLQMMTMGMNGKDSDMLKKYVDRIERSSSNLLRMIMNLIDISKIEAGTMKLNYELGDLNSIISRIQKRFSEITENESKTVNLQLDSKIPSFKFDNSVIERVIESLMTFAYTNSGGEGRIDIQTERKDDSVVLQICDDGPRLPGDLGDNLFDKYHQVEIKNNGHRLVRGLGFTFCKLAIDAHGGRLWMDSNYQAGNRFIFSLRLSDHSGREEHKQA
jgi:K+-sensing histidine kinase KdpD